MKKEQLVNHVNEVFAPEMLEIVAKKQPIENIKDYGEMVFMLTLDYNKLIAEEEDETIKSAHIAQHYRLINVITRYGLMNDIF